ncbi:twin-arginine translocase subunit TatC [Candidatus Nanohalobium constans]|uniref:Sec-independent protein translocase protein TatC n=1 Tax=Candidatus Nanohalobium constans TaxID=2565781 RepID=A0A5Q0UFM3_9ARCH|nr:twin-arginine translocase subunit TatC [Candidatus Nanohalobium constans]QGA80334.1 sec-independent protein translocase protein TatC [Candidatus Nanohalobium constans]
MQGLDRHVQELRQRLKFVSIFFLSSTVLAFYFSSNILNWLQNDLGFSLHALTAYEVLYTELMIAFLGGFLLSLPFILFEALAFMKPGLKESEYKAMRNYLPFSVFLFVTGSVFSYNFVVKTSLNFFQATAGSADVAALWGLQNTIGFALRLSAFTGIIFQLPIVSMVLAHAGVLNKDKMVEYRPYFFVGILLVSALATPPDVISQALVTVPVIFLYQISIFLVSRIEET